MHFTKMFSPIIKSVKDNFEIAEYTRADVLMEIAMKKTRELKTVPNLAMRVKLHQNRLVEELRQIPEDDRYKVIMPMRKKTPVGK